VLRETRDFQRVLAQSVDPTNPNFSCGGSSDILSRAFHHEWRRRPQLYDRLRNRAPRAFSAPPTSSISVRTTTTAASSEQWRQFVCASGHRPREVRL